MAHKAVIGSLAAEESGLSKLALYFPSAAAVRVPVRVTRVNSQADTYEETVIEYGTPAEVLFTVNLPLEFGDRLRLSNSDGLLQAEAIVVAVLCHDSKMAVAARFCGPVANWVIKK